ncbi:hypothetical protein K525DRAFT_269319 [Schizophyllum commune Loenen D]|nr:hypothetical protein K525DRAFT_269319 [Schizophyllum commune Loenen D]
MLKSITQLQPAAIGQRTHGSIPHAPLTRTDTFSSDSSTLPVTAVGYVERENVTHLSGYYPVERVYRSYYRNAPASAPAYHRRTRSPTPPRSFSPPTSTERQCGFFYIFILMTSFRMGVVVFGTVIGHQLLLLHHGLDSSWNVPEGGVARAGAIGTAILSLLTVHMWRLLKGKYLLIFFLLNCGLFPAEGAIGAAILRASGHVALTVAQCAIAALVGGLVLACPVIIIGIYLSFGPKDF